MGKIEVVNAGVPGNSSSDILARLDEITGLHPDLVCLMAGTNDALNSHKSIPLHEYEKNLAEIIRRLREASCAVILLTVPPCIDPCLVKRHGQEFFSKDSPTEKIAQVNRAVRGAAAGHNLPLVELNEAIGKDKDRFLRQSANCGEDDGVHLTPAGYEVMAGLVRDGIRGAGKQFRKIICLGDSITYGVYVAGAGTAAGECYPGRLNRLLNG